MAFLTIGMPTYQDFDGVYFTIQALRLNHDVSECEFIVIDNAGCSETENFVNHWVSGGTYIKDTSGYGTAYAKNLVFANARSPYVLCLDCHVLLLPGALQSLIDYYKKNPESSDLIQGPMFYDNFADVSTHMDPVWRGQMFGTWGYDARMLTGVESFEIPLQGMGLFSARRDRWLGFNPRFRGFGGEEGYIHEKYRQAGHRCLCFPRLGWIHRFGRPRGVPYILHLEDKVKNYIYGHIELGQDLQEIHDHFREFISPAELVRWEGECRRALEVEHPTMTAKAG